MGKKMMHIGLEKGQIGRYVFLPGSPCLLYTSDAADE